jgi:hypothetical protein
VVVVVVVVAAVAAASRVTGMLSMVFIRSYTGLWNHPLKKTQQCAANGKIGSACSVKILILMLVNPIAPLSGDIPSMFLAATHHFNSVLLSSCHRYDIHLQSL